ncbi:hypothetical protein YPPY54_1919, partial [Yersinia pestis PY-54]
MADSSEKSASVIRPAGGLLNWLSASTLIIGARKLKNAPIVVQNPIPAA